jgi:hypothetical protein
MRRLSILISVTAILLLGLIATPRLGPTTAQEATDGPDLAGSWRVVVSRADGATFLSLHTYGAEGTVVVSGLPAQPAPPGGQPGVVFFSPAHGTWEATGPESANLTYVHLRADADGQPLGPVTIRNTLTLAADGQTFTSEAVTTLADPEGNVLATFSSTGQGTRMVAEAPSAAATPEA